MCFELIPLVQFNEKKICLKKGLNFWFLFVLKTAGSCVDIIDPEVSGQTFKIGHFLV